MYNYEWDIETGGYILLPSKITGVTKEVRPVFSEELRFLGLDRDYGWDFPDCEGPLMWAEARRYFYKGELVCEASGGGLYEMPTLKNVIKDLRITPVDIEMMLSKNESVMDGLVQKTLKTTYKAYLDYKSRVSMFYVAYSGGKDSIVMLDIVQRALPHDGFVVVFGDTTMELKTTYQALSEAKAHWPSLEWYEARAEFEAEESWRRIGFPARKLRWCCSVHKTAPSIVKLKEIYKTKYPEAQRPFKVMVFDGVRAEESDARSTYTMISDGNKHAVQFNCSPILEWSSCELFLYIFKYGLLFNKLYRYGAYRVGCKLCPMASEWYECVLNHIFPEEVKPLLDIVSTSITKSFSSDEEKKKYGTGKTYASFVIKHILEDSIDSITPYFIQNGMETLLARVKGVRAKGRILVVQRSASAGINTQDKLFNAIVESVRRAVSDAGLTYTGAESLSDKVLTILKHPETSAFNFQGAFNKYRGKFTEYSSVDSIVKDLEELDLEDKMCLVF